ncbi:MAG: electron transport complex subunit E [Spirochaetales bacterium]|nr:electron transport complex subunit E [Spirochaetales bacterium]
MIREFTKGILKENPLFIIVLGLCPALAVSTEVINALGMGAGVIFVLLGSNISVSLLKNFIPEKVRIPAYIVIIASFVSIVEMVMKAYTPDLYKNLGIFVSLIVVNCVILGRAEAFASKNNLPRSVLDALGMGIGFTLGLLIISLIREVLGAGSITLFPIKAIGFNGKIMIPWISSYSFKVFAFASGALLVMGYIKAFIAWYGSRKIDAAKESDSTGSKPEAKSNISVEQAE